MRTETISIRVTPEQKEKIKAESKALNMTVSEYLKNNGSKIGGPKSYREEVQKLINLSETLSALEHRFQEEDMERLAERIESEILTLNFILKKVYESKDFQQYRR